MAMLKLPRSLRSVSLVVAVPFFAAAPLCGGAVPSEPLPAVTVAVGASEPVASEPKDAVVKPEPPKVEEKVAEPRLARRGKPEVLEVEAKLAEMGYWTGPVDGVLDAKSRAALVAFQKVEGRPRTGRIDAAERAAVLAASRPQPLESGPAHFEVDISRQVMFLVGDEGRVERIIAVSTGNNKDFVHKGVRDRAYTPRGRWTVYRQIKGMRKAPLGDIYYPSYLVGGIAVHGSPSVPVHPASHGCVRVPMYTAKELSDLMPSGTEVLIHDGGSFENDEKWLKWARRTRPQNYDPAADVNELAERRK